MARDCRGHNVGYLEIKDGDRVVFERKLVDLDRLSEDWDIDLSNYNSGVKIEPIFNKY